MKEVAKLQIKDRTELFQATAISMGMQPNVIEKDFWVCFMLDHLFHDCKYKDAFVFKGGTSLSKSYHVIERFSEDIDLILDWRKIINDEINPWEERSKTKQDLFNKQINSEAAKFYKEELIPQLNVEIKEKLGEGEWISVDTEDEMVVNFYYPQIFEAEYLRSCVRLEIGPLAEWLPCHETSITPFAAEKYPDIFSQKDTSVLTIDVERTFWEKLTILHKIANFPEGKPLPARYARHLYDVYNMGNSWVKESAFKRKELLEKDVAFKQKFYYAKGAHYENATLSSIELMPKEAALVSNMVSVAALLLCIVVFVLVLSDKWERFEGEGIAAIENGEFTYHDKKRHIEIAMDDIKSVDIKPITLGQTSKTNLAYLLVIKTNKKKYQIESERARGQAYDEVDLHRLYIWIQEKRTK